MSSQGRSARDSTAAVGLYHFDLKKPPAKRSPTLHDRPGGMVFNSGQDEEVLQPSTFYTSDASVLRGAMGSRSPRNMHQHGNLDKQPAQSEPRPGFIHDHTGNSRSTDDLLSIGAPKMPFCSDKGDEIVGECFICFNAFDEESEEMTPRNLQCGHAYCTGCLMELLRRSLHMTEIDCPTCHHVTLIEGRTVSGLPKNYPLMSLMRMLDSSSFKERNISRKEESILIQPPKCLEHDDYLRSYCLKDGSLICSSCELYGSHRGHPTKFLNEAASTERCTLEQLNREVFKQKQRMMVALSGVECMCQQVKDAGGRLEDEVDEFFQELIGLVQEKRNSVKTDVHLRTQYRVTALLGQARDLEECVAKAKAVNSKADSLLHQDDYTLLKDVKLTLDQIEGIFTHPPPMAPSARNDLKCTFPPTMREDLADCLTGASTLITPEVVTLDSSRIRVESFHDGFRVSWEEQNFSDNMAISYHLQQSKGNSDYSNIYRGSASKYTWKSELQGDVTYRFRVQVRTTEGVGNWSQPKETKRAEPSMHWHKKWRSVKVELSPCHLEGFWSGGSSNHWATFAVDRYFEKRNQYYVEVKIVSIGGKTKTKDRLAIGLIDCKKTNPNTIEWHNRKGPIGEWDGASWSFLPTSGVLKSHTIAGDGGIPYGHDLTIQTDDRIGVLLDLVEGKLSYFCNGTDLGVAFDGLTERSFLLAVSIRDKVKVRLLFPPPPYHQRKIKLVNYH